MAILDPELLKALAYQYMPVYQFVAAERYFPCSFAHYMAHSRLVADAEPDRALLTRPGPAESAATLRVCLAAGSKTHWQLLDTGARAGIPPDSPGDRPVYVHVVADPAGDHVDLVYVVFYAYNGPYAVGAGAHDSDIERVAVRICKATLLPTQVYCAAHAGGEWTPYAEMARTGDPPGSAGYGRPLVFVAASSHAAYARPRLYTRLLGLANDDVRPRTRGWRWSPSEADVRFVDAPLASAASFAEDRVWLEFPGRWGRNGPWPLQTRTWWTGEDKTRTTCWSRFWTGC